MSEKAAEAAEDVAEADSIEAEAQETEVSGRDSKAAAEDKGVEDSYKSEKDAEGSEGYHSSSLSSKDYKGNKTYNTKVANIKEARAKASGSRDISDKLKESGSTTRSLDEIVERNIEGQNVAWKELWYIVKGFLNTGDREEDHEIYKVIARKAKNGEPLTFLLPGLFQFPYTASDFEKYSGLDTVRIATRNPDEIHDILGYAAEKTKRGSILMILD